jgi:hypothetical protein
MYTLCTIFLLLIASGFLLGLLHVTHELFTTTTFPSPTFADADAALADLDGERDSRGLP